MKKALLLAVLVLLLVATPALAFWQAIIPLTGYDLVIDILDPCYMQVEYVSGGTGYVRDYGFIENTPVTYAFQQTPYVQYLRLIITNETRVRLRIRQFQKTYLPIVESTRVPYRQVVPQ